VAAENEQDRKRKRRPSGDEGAAYTSAIMTAVKQLRAGLDWSAERLAEEMAGVGVPWTRDVVVNLENGRRKTLAVHEVTALAYVLEAESPLELLVPASLGAVPIAPEAHLDAFLVRQWFLGRIGTLRQMVEARAGQGSPLRTDIEKALREHGLDGPGYEGLAAELARLTVSDHIARELKAYVTGEIAKEAGRTDGPD
jgi:hypothetical protein